MLMILLVSGIGEKLLDVLLFKNFNPSDFNLDNQTEVLIFTYLYDRHVPCTSKNYIVYFR